MTSEPSSNPYVGPNTFTEAQGHLFFGREREARELLARVLSERLVLFYAQSGAGKSSLINTRLIPQLREVGYAVLPVARVGGPPKIDITQVRNVFLFNLMLSLDSSNRAPERFADMELTTFLAGLSSDDERSFLYEAPQQDGPPPPSTLPYLLIIDQFEELITSHADQWPARKLFFEQLNQAMVADPKLWVLLSFREDYLAPIEPYAPLMVDRMRARFYMERMGEAAAILAVRKPAELGERHFAADVAEKLVNALRQVRVAGQTATVDGQYVEPVQLQVVCYQLWEKLAERPPGPITFDDLQRAGDVNEALSVYYGAVLAWVLANAPAVITERQLRTWFERALITPDRTRGLVRQGKTQTEGLPNQLIPELAKRFLLRADTRSGDTRIELVHDSFVEPILTSNRAWRASNQNALVLQAETWLAEDKSPLRLLFGEQLHAAEQQLAALGQELNEEERGKVERWLEASARQERQRADLLAAQQVALLNPQKYISEMGWGVIFPAEEIGDVDQQRALNAIKAALQPLLKHRKREATLRREELYREFVGAAGYRAGEPAQDFLARHKVGPGSVDPAVMPYYLLIVGDPEVIPFEFQYQLNLKFAVGRIHFDTPEEYRRYAKSVVRAEQGDAARPRRTALFAPRYDSDKASQLLGTALALPLFERLEAAKPDWSMVPVYEHTATKARLGRLLGGEEPPALVFIGSSGLNWVHGYNNDLADWGGPICQGWSPSAHGSTTISPEFYFSASDVAETADVHGLILFAFVPCGAGTSKVNDFASPTQGGPPPTQIERSFVARLPQRLLSHPRGGALAFISHVGTTWTYSFQLGRADSKSGVWTYAAVIESLLEGCPVGAALEPFNQRYAELAATMSELRNQQDKGELVDPIELAELQIAMLDARNWIVIGDPAVRLMVSGLQPDMAGLTLLYEVEQLRNKGDQLAEAGDLKGAAAIYAKVLALSPWLGFDPDAEARSVASRKPMREARESARVGKLEKAAAQLKAAQRLNPELGPAAEKELQRLAAPYFLDRGDAAARKGVYEKALELLRQASELDPSLGVTPTERARPLVAEYHKAEGRRLAREGELEAAIAHYEKACELNPATRSDFDPKPLLQPRDEAKEYAAQYFETYGAALAGQGDHETAVAAFRKALELKPSLQWDPEQKAAQLVAQAQSVRQRAASRPKDTQLEAQATHEADRRLWFNGVNAATGEYLTPPIAAEALVAIIRGDTAPSDPAELRALRARASSGYL